MLVNPQAAMRFFFHLRDGENLPDLEGTDLPDAAAARVEAIRLSGAMLKDQASSGWDGTEWRLTVVDETGTAIFLLRYSADDLRKKL
jgi:hypothetical protein